MKLPIVDLKNDMQLQYALTMDAADEITCEEIEHGDIEDNDFLE